MERQARPPPPNRPPGSMPAQPEGDDDQQRRLAYYRKGPVSRDIGGYFWNTRTRKEPRSFVSKKSEYYYCRPRCWVLSSSHSLSPLAKCVTVTQAAARRRKDRAQLCNGPLSSALCQSSARRVRERPARFKYRISFPVSQSRRRISRERERERVAPTVFCGFCVWLFPDHSRDRHSSVRLLETTRYSRTPFENRTKANAFRIAGRGGRRRRTRSRRAWSTRSSQSTSRRDSTTWTRRTPSPL